MAGRRPPGPRQLRGRELYRKVARLNSATEQGRVGAKAAVGQRRLDSELDRYGAAFDAKPFDAALLSLLAMVGASCAPWLRLDELHTLNRASLWLFGVDWQVDRQAQSAEEVDDVVRRSLAVAGGAEPAAGDGLGQLLAHIRADLTARPAYARLAPAWRAELDHTLDAMAREQRWRAARTAGGVAPSFEQYLDNADNVGLGFVFVTLLIIDGAPPEAWRDGPGTLREAMGATQRLLRLVNDVGTRDREATYGDLNVLELGLPHSMVDAEIRDRTRHCLELYAALHRHGIPRQWVSYLERVVGFNVGLYDVADYWAAVSRMEPVIAVPGRTTVPTQRRLRQPAPTNPAESMMDTGSGQSPEVAELLASVLAQPWGQLSPSVYETGRLVSLTPWLIGHDLRITFLLANQRADGGWGGPDGYGLVPSLSATEALLSVLRRGPTDRTSDPAGDRTGDGNGDRWVEQIAAAAGRGLRRLADWLAYPDRLSLPDTPAVEILVPTLVEALNDHLAQLHDETVHNGTIHSGAAGGRRGVGRWAGLDAWRSGRQLGLPRGVEAGLVPLLRTQVASGAALPDKLLHSLEVVGPAARGAGGVRPVAPGTVGASPAATAAWLGDPPTQLDPTALAYLEAAVRAHGGPVSSIVPVTAFERSWVLHNLLEAGLAAAVPVGLTTSLAGSLGPAGTPGGAGLPPDADTSSITILTLSRLGVRVGLEPLRAYERETHFVTWDGERTPSTTTNAHVLEAFGALGPTAGRGDGFRAWHRSVLHKVAGWLRDQQREDGTWLDKWHASPFYATAEAAGALSRHGGRASRAAVQRAIRWVLHNQYPDGSWGTWHGTAEETAYAMRLLLSTPAATSGPATVGLAAARGVAEAAARGLAYLIRSRGREHPPLWHDKDLYTPRAVVDSAVLAAIHLARTRADVTATDWRGRGSRR